jgi:hypothetical protein
MIKHNRGENMTPTNVYRNRVTLKAAFFHTMLASEYLSEDEIRDVFESALEDYKKVTEVEANGT